MLTIQVYCEYVRVEAWKKSRQLRSDFATGVPLPPGDFDKLLHSAHAARTAIMLFQIFKCEGDVTERVRNELRSMRTSTKLTEKDLFPTPLCKKIVATMMG